MRTPVNISKKIIILIIAILGVAGLFLVKYKLLPELAEIKKSGEVLLDEIKKDISAPPPLRASKESEQAYLTRGGAFKWTNAHRIDAGLVPLAENSQLNNAARSKIKDMFERQYFEHVSPTGGNIGTLLDGVGYGYIAVGENLALGNYENDQVLVQAWMDSPGHRANILSPRFMEIGIAVAQGTFDGRQTWLAVQAFALPSSACPQPNAVLKSQIESLERQITELKIRADAILTELDNMKPKRGDEYNRKAEEYNVLASQINTLIAELKGLVTQYNNQVAAFNSCINK